MEIVKQTPSKLVVVQRNERATRLFAAACALLFVGLLGLSAAALAREVVSGSTFGAVVFALLALAALFLLGLCLRALLSEQVFDFDRDLDRFSIRERTLFGRRETAGKLSRIVSVKHKLDFSGADVDTGPASEIALRYDDGSGTATRTATFGLGLADEDRQLQQTLKAFLKL